jgi:hypothetical protein
MVAHTEPVLSWGQKPCGEFALRLLPVSRWGAARRARPGPGAADPRYKRSFSVHPTVPTGAGDVAGLAERNAHNEPSPSQAAAPFTFALSVASSDEVDHRGGADCIVCEVLLSLMRLTGDLGTALT